MMKFAWIGVLFLVVVLAVAAYAVDYNIYGLVWDEGVQDWVGCGWGEECAVKVDNLDFVNTWTDEDGRALCINFEFVDHWQARWTGDTYTTVLAPGNPLWINQGHEATFLVE